MTRNRLATRGPRVRQAHRFASVRAVECIANTLFSLCLLAPAVCAASAPVRIAVAPFAGQEFGKSAAEAIVVELGERPLDRLIAPDGFVADARLDPTAEEVRRWAYNAAVETVVVGRIFATSASPEDSRGEHRIEIVVRSGHSGAELARHHVVVESPTDLKDAGGRLAAAILEDLDYTEPVAVDSRDLVHTVGFDSPHASTARLGGQAASVGSGSGRGLDTKLDKAGFDNGAPIEIKAEEAEIINRDGGRELVFQRNVFVRQANVTLRSDHLEASYRKGESEPERLVARGKVLVDQGDRRAKCDRAVYLREAQQLTCTGHAELVQGCDTVRGESIQLDLQDDRARVEGAASIVIRPDGDAQVNCGSARGVM